MLVWLKKSKDILNKWYYSLSLTFLVLDFSLWHPSSISKCKIAQIFSSVLFVKFISESQYFLYFHFETDSFEICHYFTIISLEYELFADDDKTESNEVGKLFAIIIWKYILPDPHGLVHLKFLRKYESNPSKAIIKWFYFELIQLQPYFRFKSLYNQIITNKLVEILLTRL